MTEFSFFGELSLQVISLSWKMLVLVSCASFPLTPVELVFLSLGNSRILDVESVHLKFNPCDCHIPAMIYI